MKALTLWAPHGILIPFRWKEVETRDWYTPHRGPLAIHVAKLFKSEQALDCARLQEITSKTAFHHVPASMHAWQASVRPSLGCVVATCNLVACLPASFVIEKSRQLKPPFVPALGWEVEWEMGNYTAGRWAWILRDVVPLGQPIPARGNRKLWDWNELHSTKGAT